MEAFTYGDPGDLPITGDWDGDRRTEVGVYRPSNATFYLRARTSTGAFTTVSMRYGALGSMPVVGDWNGDRRTDLGVWHPDTAVFSLRRGTTTESFKYGVGR